MHVLLKIVTNKKKFVRCGILNAGISIWNRLMKNQKKTSRVTVFLTTLKSYIFTKEALQDNISLLFCFQLHILILHACNINYLLATLYVNHIHVRTCTIRQFYPLLCVGSHRTRTVVCRLEVGEPTYNYLFPLALTARSYWNFLYTSLQYIPLCTFQSS